MASPIKKYSFHSESWLDQPAFSYVAGSVQQVAMAPVSAAHLPLASVRTSASPWTGREEPKESLPFNFVSTNNAVGG